MRLRNDIGKNHEEGRSRLLCGEIQTSHTSDCPAVDNTRSMWRAGTVAFVFVAAGRSHFGFCRGIVDRSAYCVEKVWLRRMPPKGQLPLDGKRPRAHDERLKTTDSTRVTVTAKRRLADKHRYFVEEARVDGNATQAAEKAAHLRLEVTGLTFQ